MSELPYLAFDADNHYYEAGQAQSDGPDRNHSGNGDRGPEVGAA